MYSKLAISSVLFALSVSAQSSVPASSIATPTSGSASQPQASSAAPSQTENLVDAVDFLLPSASITSLSPEQSAKVASDAGVFFSQYTQSHPVSDLENSVVANAGVNGFLGGTEPSGAQVTSIQNLLGQASAGLVENPSAYISSVNAIISPFPFATLVNNYESGFIDGLRTVVASDLGQSVPPAATPTSTSTGAAAPARPTGVVAGGVAIAAGLVGAALL